MKAELLAALCGFTIATSLAHAEEGGAGHYMPGSMATLIDLPPTKPGWAVVGIGLHYQGDASLSLNLPNAGLVTAGMSATSNAFTVPAVHSVQTSVLGATFSFGGSVSQVSVEVSGFVENGAIRVAKSDRISGVGDMTLIPAMFAWKKGEWQIDAQLNVIAPTGRYALGRLANTGMNYWTADPVVGVAYMGQKNNVSFALHGGLTLNTENQATHYRSGSVFHLETSLAKIVPLGGKLFAFGVSAYTYQQVSGDSGAGAAKLGAFKGETNGMGPTLTYLKPGATDSFVCEVKYLKEFGTRNRLEGDSLWLKVAYQF